MFPVINAELTRSNQWSMVTVYLMVYEVESLVPRTPGNRFFLNKLQANLPTSGTLGICHSPVSRTPEILNSPASWTSRRFLNPRLSGHRGFATPRCPRWRQVGSKFNKKEWAIKKANPWSLGHRGFATNRCPGLWRFSTPRRLGHMGSVTPRCPRHYRDVFKLE